ncbi:unnamed protein product, partial [Didymodactylos carnosus]
KQHVTDIEEVLGALNTANVKLNVKKCALAKKELDYLGFRITHNGIKPMTANKNEFGKKHHGPTNDFTWTTQCQIAFETLTSKLSQYPLLAFPDGHSKLQLSTDASDVGIGGVLNQITKHGIRPITYLSRSLTPPEKKYSTVEKECLAIVWCIKKLHPYLYGEDFTVFTDHHPLCWLNKQSSHNGRLERWSLQLQEYTFDVKHVSGKRNCVADCLSRYPSDPPDDLADKQLDIMHPPKINSSLEQNAEVNNLTTSPLPARRQTLISFDPTKIEHEQLNDPTIKRIRQQLFNGQQVKSFILDNGVVYKLIQRSTTTPLQLPYVPRMLVNDLLMAHHTHPTAAHVGVTGTWNKLRDRYYWPGMHSSIQSFISSCQLCQQYKISRRTPAGHLQPTEIPQGVFEKINMDFIDPLPTSTQGHKYILVCNDYLSKYIIAQPCQDCSATTAAKFLVEQVTLVHGTPRVVVTDNGSHFTGQVYEAVASRLALVERIGTLTHKHPANWDEYISFVTHSYNTTKHSTTGLEPSKLVFGRNLVLPFDPPKNNIIFTAPNDYYVQLIRCLEETKQTAKQNIKHQQTIYKKHYDTGRRDRTLAIGQLIFVEQTPHKMKKFFPKWDGPYEVIKQTGRLNYEVGETQIQ